MTKSDLVKHLELLENAKRENRLRVAHMVLNNPNLFPYLIEVIFNFKNRTAIKAAWILEFVCAEKIDWLAPHLSYFTEQLKLLKHDSAIRPVSKVCMFLAQTYTSKKESIIKNSVSKKHIDAIIETNFDWMISNCKVATKAYGMQTLYLFGKNYDWVHQELKLIIVQNMATESAAYKARGKMTLALINKK